MTRSDRFCLWLSHQLPRRLVYWCAICVIAFATTGEYGDQVVGELSAMDALKRFWKRVQ